MNSTIEKAYDIIIENQRNADPKANIFIVLLTGFLAFIGKIPVSIIDTNTQEAYQQFYLIMVIPLILFVMSLIPIINHKFKFRLNTKEKLELNIFHWKSIVKYKNDDTFILDYINIYKLDDCSRAEIDLLKQIYVNSMILEYKFSIQNYAFFIIIQFIIVFLSSMIAFLSFNSDPYCVLISMIIIEVLVYSNKTILVNVNKITKKVKQIVSKLHC
jgi:hypothetical protein